MDFEECVFRSHCGVEEVGSGERRNLGAPKVVLDQRVASGDQSSVSNASGVQKKEEGSGVEETQEYEPCKQKGMDMHVDESEGEFELCAQRHDEAESDQGGLANGWPELTRSEERHPRTMAKLKESHHQAMHDNDHRKSIVPIVPVMGQGGSPYLLFAVAAAASQSKTLSGGSCRRTVGAARRRRRSSAIGGARREAVSTTGGIRTELRLSKTAQMPAS